jgi:hypothetical protein
VYAIPDAVKIKKITLKNEESFETSFWVRPNHTFCLSEFRGLSTSQAYGRVALHSHINLRYISCLVFQLTRHQACPHRNLPVVLPNPMNTTTDLINLMCSTSI